MHLRRQKRPTPENLLNPVGLQDLILFQDDWVLVIDKPAGIPVHQGPGGGPHLGEYVRAPDVGPKTAPELAHRLDRLTSGCLVLGRHHRALRRLGTLFANGQVDKCYWALVSGIPATPSGHLDAPLRPCPEKSRKTPSQNGRMEVHPDGHSAHTDFRVLGTFGALSWLELRPRSGRTHQIRVHCAHMGCPVVGDPLYGLRLAAGSGSPFLQLHARSITMPLYTNQKPINVVAPPPRHMLPLLIACGYPSE
ncbi:MAG: RNA pseudouridine synthase [Magnetococcales bacterium]|nr:RNA pseudouridine synthase [Magnetococcales bacterium]